MNEFPVCDRHDDVSCFNCWGDLAGEWWSESGNAPGRGKYRVRCSRCDMLTFYDLKEERHAVAAD